MKKYLNLSYFVLILISIIFFPSLQANIMKLRASSNINFKPNIATVQITISSKDKEASQAVAKNAKKITSVLTYLKKTLPGKDNVSTTNYQLTPDYQWDEKNKKNILIGYESSMQLTIIEEKLPQLGSLLDGLVKIGLIEINNVNLENNNTEKYQEQALNMAIKKGITQAHDLASTAKIKLGRLKYLEPLSSMAPRPVYKMNSLLASATSPSTPIAQGKLTLSQTVELIFTFNPYKKLKASKKRKSSKN